MYLDNPEMLNRVQAIYPGARAVEVLPHVVWVRCEPVAWKGRQLPGGAVMLGTSPATAALEREIRAVFGD